MWPDSEEVMSMMSALFKQPKAHDLKFMVQVH